MAGQVWSTSSLGGYLFSPPLSKVLRYAVQPLVKFRQFADIKDAATQGKGKGDTMHWNVRLVFKIKHLLGFSEGVR